MPPLNDENTDIMGSWKNSLKRVLGKSETAIQAIALTFFVAIGVLCLSEISSRIEYLGYLDSEIQAKSNELNVKLQSNEGNATTNSKDSEAAKLSRYILQLQRRQDLTMLLIFKGAGKEKNDLDQIMNLSDDAILKDFPLTRGILPAMAGATTAPMSQTDVNRPGFSWQGNSYWSAVIGSHQLSLFSSNILLALLLASCGAVGALTAGLRTNDFTTFKDLCLGLGTGFICYLTIRGGKDLFVANIAHTRIALNPYSSGLTAVLAGLFTERFFNLLTTLFASFDQRIRAAFGSSAPENGGQE